ncbi:MAG: HIRAN domain-containing protein [Bacillota bacterium]
MLELLKDIARLGYLEDWTGSAEDFILLIRGIQHLQDGAIWAGIHQMQRISRWHLTGTRLLSKYVSEEVLLNTAAELYHSTLKWDKRLLLILGAVLGPRALTLQDYFVKATHFITRAVGLRHNHRFDELAGLEPGDRVAIERDHDNNHDPNAIVVLAPGGRRLGYLYAPLAAVIAARYARGEVFGARVAAVLSTSHDTSERLHVEIWKENRPDAYVFPDFKKRRVSGTGVHNQRVSKGVSRGRFL